MLRSVYDFDIPREDLVLIYTVYIRSVPMLGSPQSLSMKGLKENIVVWPVSEALEKLNLTNLSDRRQKLARKYVQK